jgi:iron(III) transport system substrate-binding protein
VSPNAAGIPAAFKDPAGHWTGFGARARVLVWNREQILEDELPKTMEDLAAPRFKDKLLIAKPLTGTTLTHVAALYTVWGEERTNSWLDRLMANGVSWEMGNGPVAQKVADGVRPMGLTDTDDVNVRRLDGHPVGTAYLDQGEGGLGTFVIPNTVMIMKGAPNPAEARLLVDFLLSPRVEGLLAKGRAAQMPLHPDVAAPEHVVPVSRLKTMDVDFGAVGAAIEKRALDLNDRFARVQGGELVDDGKGSMALLWAVVALVLAGIFIFLALRPGREGAARS